MSDLPGENRPSSYFAFPSLYRSFWRHFLHVLLVTEVGSECFYPDGTPRLEAQPCRPTQNQSFCCLFGWACLENRMCRTAPGIADRKTNEYARGSCTDSTWESDQCPQFCFANRSMGMSMLSCHDKGTYCCGEEACDCNTGSGTITLKDSASAFTTIGLFQSPTTSESKASSTVPTPSSTNLSATSPNLGSSLSLFSVPHLPSASAPVASDLQQPRPSSPPSKLGIGTGVPIGILLVMALVFIVRHNRRLRTELQKFYNGLSPNNSIFNRFFLNRLKGSDRTKEMQNPIFELPTSSS